MTGIEDSELPPDEIREAQEIARRALVLFAVVALALGAPRKDIIDWLQTEGLWNELSPMELQYVSTSAPTDRDTLNMSWRSEALIVLLWELGLVDKLPAANEQCDASIFQGTLPPFTRVSVAEFTKSATRRPDDDLIGLADDLVTLHWTARDAKIHSRAPPPEIDIEIIQERHHAINWSIGYDGAPWDEVTTDT